MSSRLEILHWIAKNSTCFWNFLICNNSTIKVCFVRLKKMCKKIFKKCGVWTPLAHLSIYNSIAFYRILQLGGSLDLDKNPNDWWRVHHHEFPLLAKWWMANCTFPATSTSSERAFSIDNLIIDSQRYLYTFWLITISNISMILFIRQSLIEERSKNLVIVNGFLDAEGEQVVVRLVQDLPRSCKCAIILQSYMQKAQLVNTCLVL